jgi:hypothetical protein
MLMIIVDDANEYLPVQMTLFPVVKYVEKIYTFSILLLPFDQLARRILETRNISTREWGY